VTQASTENTPVDINDEQSASLKTLTIVGYLEGTSFLLLLGIAMPLKYMMGIPEGVKYLGMAHGLLFITYIVILMGTANKVKMPLWAMPTGVIASVLPFGPFVFDALLKKSLKKSKKD
jgi:integral membrane protein